LNLEIIKGINNFRDNKRQVVATIGTFDGLHRGHQEILRQMMESAKKLKADAVAITFEPHPRVLVTPNDPPPLLSTWEEKIKLFSKYMSGRLLVLDFNNELMNLTAEEFIRNYLTSRLNLKKLVVGYDHALGKNRSGTINDLMGLSQIYGFELAVVNPIIVNDRPISSSRIRRLIADNDFPQALEMLNHSYPIGGTVVQGIGLGKKLGYPTANIDFTPRKLLPTDGVYSCRLEYRDKEYDGMMFIGKNHFNPDKFRSVEAHIFSFNKDIYGEQLTCYPETYIRANQKFESTDKLKEQLKKDKENVLELINKGDDRSASQ